MKHLIRQYLQKLWHDSAAQNNQMLASYVKQVKRARILDIGCESGSLIIERVTNIIDYPEIYGIEIDPIGVKNAQKLGIKAILANAEEPFPFRRNFFDIVCANQIIEHLNNTDLFLSEILRVLKPEGYLLLATENLSSWHNIFALILGWQAFSQDISSQKVIGNPFKLYSHQKPNWALHLKIFTYKSLRELLEFHGFEIEKTFGAGYYPILPSVARIFEKIDPEHCAFIGLKARKKI